MTTNNRRLLLAAAAAAVLCVPRAEATLARAVSFDDKVENSASIVLGRCVRTEAQWDASHRFIVTYSTFAVEKSMKGNAAGEVTVAVPGGQVGGIHQESIGMPAFDKGEENVVFIRNSQIGPTVAFADQGAYNVVKDERGERIVQPVETSVALIDTQTGKAVAGEEPKTLAQFERDVRATIDRQQAYRMELIAKQKERQASLAGILGRYKLLVGLALLGAAVATWILVKRT